MKSDENTNETSRINLLQTGLGLELWVKSD